MPERRIMSMWDGGDGEAARCYADRPYAHYKGEVYPVFCEILDGLGDGARVLDVGAGPGHLAWEFHRARPGSRNRFVLVDVGRAMLDIARERMAGLGVEIECHQRSFNLPDWADGLGRFDAVVSNNALFNLKPELVGGFYRAACGLLKEDGLLLNQQSLAHEDPAFAGALEDFPDVLSHGRQLSDEERERRGRLLAEQNRIVEAQANERKRGAEKLRAAGHEVVEGDPVGYASLHLPASEHIRLMREAGLAAGCIWRKMEFVVLAGIRGRPFGGSREKGG